MQVVDLDWLKKIISNKKIQFCFLITFIFGLIAHGYSYFNLSYSHDSLVLYQNDWQWQMSIGRFMHAIVFLIRGHYYVPWLVGFISLVFISLTLYFLSEIFNIKSKLAIGLIGGLLTSNVIYTLINATYSHDIDIYMMSLFFSVLGVYLILKGKKFWLLGVFSFVVCLGLYQSFINCSVVIFMILAIKDLFDGKSIKEVFLKGIKWILLILLSFLIYFIVFKSLLLIFDLGYGKGYNDLSKLGKYGSFGKILSSFVLTYGYFIEKTLIPFGYKVIVTKIINIISLILVFILIFYINFKKNIKLKKFLFILFLVYLFPFGINVTCFISQGILHDLMVYSFVFLYIFVIWLVMYFNKVRNTNKKFKYIVNYLVIGMYFVLIFNNFIYSNQVYLIKKLNYQNTLLFANRIIYSLESLEGYKVGQTPVVFIGYTDLMNSSTVREGVDYNPTGLWNNFSVTYYDTYDYFFNRIMNYKINIDSDYFEEFDYYERTDLIDMPNYPEEGSIKEIDGIIFVKLSDYFEIKVK